MVGSPKKRARRLALEAERTRLGLNPAPPAPVQHTVPPPPKPDPVEWADEPKPNKPPPVEDDPIVSLLEDGYMHPERSDDVLTPQDAKFNQLRELALDSAVEIMSLKLDPDHKSFDKLLARKTTIAAAVMTTTVRIDAGKLRGRVRDKVDEILKAIEEASGKPKN